MASKWWILTLLVGVVLAACAGNGSDNTSPSTTSGTPTTAAPWTSTGAATTTTVLPSTGSTPVPTTTMVEDSVDITEVTGWVHDWLEAAFNSETEPYLTGALQLVCAESGAVGVGDVFACALVPQPEPGLALEAAGIVVYVLDESGRAVWQAGDLPDTTEELVAVYDSVPKGLLCRDLVSSDMDLSLFGSDARTTAKGFFWSLVYWSLEGQPDRMDADGNGVPCETLYESTVVAAVLQGGAIGGDEPLSTVPDPGLGIVLSADGLGIVPFGHPVDDAVAILTEQLGTPSSDEFPYPGESIFPGTYWRVVRWDTPNLDVHFMDWRPFETLDTPILGYWGAGMGTPTLATVEGIGPGTPWVDVVAAYGDRVVAAGPDDEVCRSSWVFSIDRDRATDYFFHMRGDLDGDPADPATAIRTIYAGVAMEGC